MPITPDALAKIAADVQQLLTHTKYASRRRAAKAAEAQTASPGFWQNPQRAQTALEELKKEKKALDALSRLEALWEELSLAHTLWTSQEASEAQVQQAHKKLNKLLGNLRLRLTMQDPHSEADAIMDIRSGAGGMESQDWAAMLLRMYTLWATQQSYTTTTLHHHPGEETGIKCATIKIAGDHAYGMLKGEHGIHRLVRLSPFDAQHKRHTSFASINVYPDIVDDINITLHKSDLVWETFRSSGSGGQNVNKVETAVRVRHLPSNTVVTCGRTRQQGRNKELARHLLKLKLHQAALEQRDKERAQRNKEQKKIDFGSQTRNYILHPYKKVKDTRTAYESPHVQKVLDGDLTPLIQAYLLTQSKG